MTRGPRVLGVLWPFALLFVFVSTFRPSATDPSTTRASECDRPVGGSSAAPGARDIDVLERCAEEDPRSAARLVDLGKAQQAAGREDLAESTYRRALTLDARDSATHVRLGELLMKHGDRSAARREAEAALRWHPGSAAALDLAARSTPPDLANDQ